MRLIYAVFGLLLLILGALAWLLVMPEPELATGAAHPDFPGMNVGGDGGARLGDAAGPIGVLGALVMLLMLLLPVLGVKAQRRTLVFWLLIVGIGLAGQLVWWSMYMAYLDFLLVSFDARFVLGFPLATSWMLFGVWSSGALLCLVYVLGFRRFIFSEEDEAAYEALRAAAEVPRAASEPDRSP